MTCHEPISLMTRLAIDPELANLSLARKKTVKISPMGINSPLSGANMLLKAFRLRDPSPLERAPLIYLDAK